MCISPVNCPSQGIKRTSQFTVIHKVISLKPGEKDAVHQLHVSPEGGEPGHCAELPQR